MNDLFPPAGFSSLVFLDASFEIVAVQDFAIRRFATTGVHLKQAQDAVARVWKEKERGKGSEREEEKKAKGKRKREEKEAKGKRDEYIGRCEKYRCCCVCNIIPQQHSNTATQQHSNATTQQHSNTTTTGSKHLPHPPDARTRQLARWRRSSVILRHSGLSQALPLPLSHVVLWTNDSKK